MLREKKNSRATLETLWASVSMLNVNVHDKKIRESLKNYGLCGMVVRRKSILYKKNMSVQLELE